MPRPEVAFSTPRPSYSGTRGAG